MRKRTTLVRLAAMTLPALALVAATPAPARADVPAGYLTLFEDQLQGGNQRSFSVTHPKLKNAGFNDKASSVYNRSTTAWVVYEDTNYSGDNFCVQPGQDIEDLHGAPWFFGDKISSVVNTQMPDCGGLPQRP